MTKTLINYFIILLCTFKYVHPLKGIENHRSLANKKIEAAGLTVDILGQSGKINLQNGQSNVQITMDALRELDSSGNTVGKRGSSKHSINTFASTSFTFDATETETELFWFNQTANETQLGIAKGIMITFHTTLDTGSKLFVEASVVNEGGIAGDSGGNWTVKPGDFKWNIAFNNWNWCSPCNDGVAEYVELDIEIKGNDDDVSIDNENNNSNSSSVDLGEGTEVELANFFMTQDGNVHYMPDGYPKVSTKDGKTLFTFRFPKFDGDATYDPIIAFNDASYRNAGVVAGMMIGFFTYLMI